MIQGKLPSKKDEKHRMINYAQRNKGMNKTKDRLNMIRKI